MRKVFLDELPRWEKGEGTGRIGTINWNKCIGLKIPFIYDDIEGEIEIVECINSRKFLVKYNEEVTNITRGDLVDCRLRKVLGLRVKEFKIEIGQTFKDNKRDITITDKEYRERERFSNKTGKIYINKQKYYKYKCNKCTYEDWMIEHSILGGTGCSCCCESPRVVVPEINSIWKTDPWMIDLGLSEEDAKKYTKSSSEKVKVICPNCKRERITRIADIYRNKTIGCTCGDGYSYPEKFVSNMLKQINVEFQVQLSKTNFKWCNKYKYDFYIPSLSMIIEVHGIQHYEQTRRKGTRTLAEEQENDRIKRELALSNGIKHYIELDCRYSDLEYIKNNILNSELIKHFNLININWNKCENFALSNIVKEVCEYWSNREEWETTQSVAPLFNVNRSTIREYLKKGTKLGWCHYDAKEEQRKGRERTAKSIIQKYAKPLEIFRDGKSLGVFESASELEKMSEELFGVKLLQSKVRSVCLGKKPQYKGFTFMYI